MEARVRPQLHHTRDDITCLSHALRTDALGLALASVFSQFAGRWSYSRSIILINSSNNAKYMCDLRHGSSNGCFVFPRVMVKYRPRQHILCIRNVRSHRTGRGGRPHVSTCSGLAACISYLFLRKVHPFLSPTSDTFPTMVIAIHRQFECFPH